MFLFFYVLADRVRKLLFSIKEARPQPVTWKMIETLGGIPALFEASALLIQIIFCLQDH
jgi:hypothetical protein